MPKDIALQVTGLHCASCVGRAEAALSKQSGVEAVSVNLATGVAQVSAARSVAAETLAEALTAAGYPAQPKEAAAPVEPATDALWRRFWIAAALTLPVFILEMGGHLYPPFHHWVMRTIGLQTSWFLQFLLVSAVLVWPGHGFFTTGFRALFRGSPEINSLVAWGAGAAWVFVWGIVYGLCVGWVVDGGDESSVDADGVMDDACDGCEAVGGA